VQVQSAKIKAATLSPSWQERRSSRGRIVGALPDMAKNGVVYADECTLGIGFCPMYRTSFRSLPTAVKILQSTWALVVFIYEIRFLHSLSEL